MQKEHLQGPSTTNRITQSGLIIRTHFISGTLICVHCPKPCLGKESSSHIFISEANLQDPPVRPSVRRSQNLVTTTLPKRLDGLS